MPREHLAVTGDGRIVNMNIVMKNSRGSGVCRNYDIDGNYLQSRDIQSGIREDILKNSL
jgi:hypothetical protein